MSPRPSPPPPRPPVLRPAGGMVPVLATAILVFVLVFCWLALQRHAAFWTGRFDLGNMVQAVWATAHGHPLEVTSTSGVQFIRLGAHVDPILALFAPLWWVWPAPQMLLVLLAIGQLEPLDYLRHVLCAAAVRDEESVGGTARAFEDVVDIVTSGEPHVHVDVGESWVQVDE